MATVAEQLRRGREARGLSVYQVADTLKMRTDHVRALEEGQYEAFIAKVYIRGFVRTYAALVKLEVPDLMKQLDAELALTEKFSEPPSLTNEPPGALDRLTLLLARINWRIALPVLAVLVVGLASLWSVRAWQDRRTKDPLAGIGPGLYQPAKKLAGETLPVPSATTTATTRPRGSDAAAPTPAKRRP